MSKIRNRIPKPRPLSSIVTCQWFSVAVSRTWTCCAPLCLRTFNQTFLDNAGKFAANSLRHLDLVQLRDKPGAYAIFTMKALHSIEEEASTSNDFICCISSRSCSTSSRRRPWMRPSSEASGLDCETAASDVRSSAPRGHNRTRSRIRTLRSSCSAAPLGAPSP